MKISYKAVTYDENLWRLLLQLYGVFGPLKRFKSEALSQHFLALLHVTQSNSKTQITRSVDCKFNCITVAFQRTQHSI